MNLQTLQKMYVLAILKYAASCWKTNRISKYIEFKNSITIVWRTRINTLFVFSNKCIWHQIAANNFSQCTVIATAHSPSIADIESVSWRHCKSAVNQSNFCYHAKHIILITQNQGKVFGVEKKFRNEVPPNLFRFPVKGSKKWLVNFSFSGSKVSTVMGDWKRKR